MIPEHTSDQQASFIQPAMRRALVTTGTFGDGIGTITTLCRNLLVALSGRLHVPMTAEKLWVTVTVTASVVGPDALPPDFV